MTQENKEILFRDLCARLPYGVFVSVHDTFKYSTVPYENVFLKASDISSLIDSISLNERYSNKDKRFNRIIKERKDYLEYKPLLFPMSSMTEEQEIEYDATFATIIYEDGRKDSAMTYKSFDWLNKNHFDYRGLIPMGLAIDATGLNIY